MFHIIFKARSVIFLVFVIFVCHVVLQLIILLLQPHRNDSLNIHGSFNYCCNMLQTFSLHWLIYFGFLLKDPAT